MSKFGKIKISGVYQDSKNRYYSFVSYEEEECAIKA